MRSQLIATIDVLDKLIGNLCMHGDDMGGPIVDQFLADKLLPQLSDAKKQLQHTPSHFDARRFSDALKNAIGDRTLREVAVEVGVSISTLSRISLGNKPDIDTFATICYWMNTLPIEFFNTPKS